MRKDLFGLLILVLLVLLSGCLAKTEITALDNDVVRFTPSVNLDEDFLDPPGHARARAYWWWLEGNTSKEGIVSDLTEM